MTRCSAVIATFALACASASGSQPWFENKREGWFWYNEAIIEEPAESPTEETPVDRTSAADPMPRADVVPQGPAGFSSAWLRENLDEYLETAIDDPTPENVQAFLYLQRLSLDRAERFSDAVSMALVADPALDETTRSPIAPFAANQTPKVVAERRARMLEHISTQAGIFFFFESTCPYCQAQAPVLSRLAEAYGFTVYAVSVDGHALPGGEFPDFRVDRGTAEQLGVINYPAMFLVAPPNSFVNLAQGAVSMLELEERIVQASVLLGLITEDELQDMRMRPTQTLADISAPTDAELSTNAAALVLRMRQQLGRGL